MRKLLLLSLIIALILGAGACSKKPNSADKQKIEKASAEPPNTALVDVIKKGKLANFQSATIGAAFDSYKYLKNKEWKQQQESSVFVIDFMGWFGADTLNEADFKAGLTGKGLDVKFVVEPNGSYYVFMISTLEARSDGKVYTSPYKDITRVLTSIYANEKISL